MQESDESPHAAAAGHAHARQRVRRKWHRESLRRPTRTAHVHAVSIEFALPHLPTWASTFGSWLLPFPAVVVPTACVPPVCWCVQLLPQVSASGRRYRLTDYVPAGVADIALGLEDINDLMVRQATCMHAACSMHAGVQAWRREDEIERAGGNDDALQGRWAGASVCTCAGAALSPTTQLMNAVCIYCPANDTAACSWSRPCTTLLQWRQRQRARHSASRPTQPQQRQCLASSAGRQPARPAALQPPLPPLLPLRQPPWLHTRWLQQLQQHSH
jgi:hypothetical protein